MLRPLLLLLVGLALVLACSSPALAVTFDVAVEGGSDAQREAVYLVLESCEVPPSHLLRVTIAEAIPGAQFRTAAIWTPDGITMRVWFDNFRPDPQRVSYARGEANALFRDILCHEYGHEVYYNALPEEARRCWERSHFQLPGWPPASEAFAENFRLTMYPEALLYRTITVSPYPMLDAQAMREWLGRFGPEKLPCEEGSPY